MITRLNGRHILALEDDHHIQQIICQTFSQFQVEVTVAGSGDEAFSCLRQDIPDIVILDKELPDIDGIQWLTQLRASSRRELANLPVLMLTAAAMQNDKLKGFDAGADDYMTKPFDPKELRARAASILSRSVKTEDKRDFIRMDGLFVDIAARNVRIGETLLKLCDHEFGLFLRLAQDAGQVIHRNTLLVEVFNYPVGVESRTIDMHVSRVRRKLGAVQNTRYQIETVRGYGYKLTQQEHV